MKEIPRDSQLLQGIFILSLLLVKELIFFGHFLYHGADVIAKEHPY